PGHGVLLRLVRVIDIDAQHAALKFAQILACVPTIRVARAVAGRDVEHSVETENQAAAVVALRVPVEDHLLRERVASLRRRASDVEARNAVRARQFTCDTMEKNEELPVGSIPGMERDAVNQPVACLQKGLDLIRR